MPHSLGRGHLYLTTQRPFTFGPIRAVFTFLTNQSSRTETPVPSIYLFLPIRGGVTLAPIRSRSSTSQTNQKLHFSYKRDSVYVTRADGDIKAILHETQTGFSTYPHCLHTAYMHAAAIGVWERFVRGACLHTAYMHAYS